MATPGSVLDTEDWVPTVGLGDRLRIVRRKKQRSQEEMAAMLEVKKVTYASWEAGASPSYDVVLTIARRLYLLDRVPQWWTLGAGDAFHPEVPTQKAGRADYGSEGWEFESLRARSPFRRVVKQRRRNSSHVVPLSLVAAAIPA